MLFGRLIDQTLKRIEVLHPMQAILAGTSNEGLTSKLGCCGAVALIFDAGAVVLRSPLRYGRPTLGEALKRARLGRPTVTLCSREESWWLQLAIGASWRRAYAIQQKATGIHWTGERLIVELDSSELAVISYREDLDAAWLIDADGCDHQVKAIEIASPGCAFGWLLPESLYRIFWNGQDWQHLAVLWACQEKLHREGSRDAVFRSLYAIRLRQHPNLLRRFTALRYPVNCKAQPWLTSQIEHMRVNGLPPHTNFNRDWLA